MKMNRTKAFTLVEALVAVLIASVITIGVFSYFSDSIRGVAHTDKTMQALALLQEISRKTRHKAYNIAPFRAGIGIDLYQPPDRFFIHKRHFTLRLVDTNNTSEKTVAVDPVTKNYVKKFLNGEEVFETRRAVDSYFLNKPAIPFSSMEGYEDALCVIVRKIPDIGEVVDHFLYTEGRKMILRFHPSPRNYVDFIEVDSKGKETIVESFGKKEQNIIQFSLSPVFDLSYCKPIESLPEKEFRFLRFFVDIHITVGTEKSQRGPKGGLFENHFRVTSLFINANRYGRGFF